MYLINFAAIVVISLTTLFYQIHSEQPGCENDQDIQMEFYQEFYKKNTENSTVFPTNFVCKAKFKKKLKMCVNVLRAHLKRGIETYYTLNPDAENVEENCITKDVTFWWVNKTETRTIEFYKCPITKIRHEIISGYFVPKQEDFYITKGWSKPPALTIFMLRPSNTSENLCVLGEYFWIDG